MSLTRQEIDQFHFEGYLGPYPVISSEQIAGVRDELFDSVFTSDGPNPKNRTHSRHLDTKSVYDIVSHPNIVGRIASLIGEDVMLWTCGVFIKEPNGVGKGTEWHQDINYWPLEPAINITAWIAIEDVDEDNSPLKIIPGSHRQMLPHVKSEGTLGEAIDPTSFDESKAVSMLCNAGEFVLFSERTVHGSSVNLSDRRRTGLVARYTLPMVRLFPDESPINFAGYRALIVSGEDKFGFNPIGQGPGR